MKNKESSSSGVKTFFSGLFNQTQERACFCSIFLLLFINTLAYGQPNIKLNNVSIEKGLSQNTVLSTLKDPDGFMWFGTQDGLNKYDGYTFTTYRNIPKDSTSLSHDYVSMLFQDNEGKIWVGTWGGGLNLFDKRKGTFQSFRNDPENPRSLSHDHVNYICQDKSGTLWVATKKGLNKFDQATGTFEVFKHRASDPHSLSFNDVSVVFVDHFGNLWAGTWGGGLNRYNPKTHDFTIFKREANNPKSLSHNIIRSIMEDSDGKLWLGTWGGLNKFDPDTQSFTNFIPEDKRYLNPRHRYISAVMENGPDHLWVGSWGGGFYNFDKRSKKFEVINNQGCDPKELSIVSSFYRDNENIVWISTMGNGIYFFSDREEPFSTYQNVPGYQSEGQELSNDDINALFTDKNGTIWIGTEGGLNLFDPVKKTFTVYKAGDVYQGEPKNFSKTGSLSSNSISAIFQDHMGNYWVGTHGGGLNLFDPETGISKVFKNDKSNPQSLSSDDIRAIGEDDSGNIWVGTWGGGLNVLNPKDSTFKVFKNDKDNSKSLSNDFISCIYKDRHGRLWIGTGQGLNRYIAEKGIFKVFNNNPEDRDSKSSQIFDITEDSKGNIWIGSQQDLRKLDPESGTFTIFTEKDGLPANEIYTLLQDDKKNIWVSTNRGISKFNPSKKTFENFDIRDGLQNSIFNFQVSEKGLDGKFYFGGIAGFTTFNPDSIKGNQFIPPVRITSVKSLNKEVLSYPEVLYTNSIAIPSRDVFFTIEFSSLSYALPEKNRYKYKLEGFDEDWVYAGTKREATYTNLDGGTYTFHVIGSNNNGVWNKKETLLTITIIPPWWKTTWFKILFGIFLTVLVTAGYKLQTRRILNKNKALEAKVAERTQQIEFQKREIELNHNKLNKLNLEISHKNEELERKVFQRTKELHEREHQLRLITDALPVLISYIDHDHRFRFSNKTYEEWFGLTSNEILGKQLWEVVGKEAYERSKDLIEKALKGETIHFEDKMLFKGNKEQFVSSFLIPHIEGDEVLGFYTLTTDITHRIQIEEALAEALKEAEQKNEELLRINTDLDNFVYTASHDLRSPITNLEGLLHLIIKNLEGKIAQFDQEVLVMMNNSIIRLKRTINELGEIAKVQKEYLTEELLSFKEVISEVKADIGSSIEESEVEIFESLEIDTINYPHKHLRSILYNLISNGIKYRSPKRRARIEIKTIQNGEKIQLSVTDNGLGLEESQVKKIFKMFKRLHTHVEGSGVGLYIVKRIIENNGGSITVESQTDVGTTFYVNF